VDGPVRVPHVILDPRRSVRFLDLTIKVKDASPFFVGGMCGVTASWGWDNLVIPASAGGRGSAQCRTLPIREMAVKPTRNMTK
jgi:hypothetical protein